MFRSSFIAVALAASVFSGVAAAAPLVDLSFNDGHLVTTFDTSALAAAQPQTRYLGDSFENNTSSSWNITYISVWTKDNTTSLGSLKLFGRNSATLTMIDQLSTAAYDRNYAGTINNVDPVYRVDFKVNVGLAADGYLDFWVGGINSLLGQDFTGSGANGDVGDHLEITVSSGFNRTNTSLGGDLNFLVVDDTLPPPFAVPEPTSLALFGVAMAGLLAARRRKV